MNRTIIALIAATGLTAAASAEELIVTGAAGIIESIDLDSGQVANRGVCSGPVQSMAVADGTLYLGTTFGTVWEYDLDLNQIVDSFPIAGQSRAMAWDGAQLLIANAANTIITINPETHAVVDTRTVPSSDLSTIGIDAGGLFAGGHDTLAFRAPIGASTFEFFAACGSSINAMAFGAQTMYLVGSTGANNGAVYRFDKFVGGVTYEGTFHTNYNPTTVLAYNGLLYVGGADGKVHEVHPVTGEEFRVFTMLSAVSGIAPTQGLVSCPADYDISGDLNFFDVAAFLSLFDAHLPAADTNGDGAFDIHDVLQFLDMFAGGCD